MSYKEKIIYSTLQIPICDICGQEGEALVIWNNSQRHYNWVESCRFCGKDICPKCRRLLRVPLCIECEKKLDKKIQEEKEEAIKTHWY